MQLKFAFIIISSLFRECQSGLPNYSIYRTFKEGTRIILSCTFDRPVPCSWRINGSYVPASPDLYTYLNPNELLPNTICTIEISNFNSTMHSGYWNCAEFDAPLSQTRVSYHLNTTHTIKKIIGINVVDGYLWAMLWAIISIFAFMVILVTVTWAISAYFKVNNKQEEQELQQRLCREAADQELSDISEKLIHD